MLSRFVHSEYTFVIIAQKMITFKRNCLHLVAHKTDLFGPDHYSAIDPTALSGQVGQHTQIYRP